MDIEEIICDHCNVEYPYPFGLTLHSHDELEIDGVPMNIWSPTYYLPSDNHLIISNESGVLRFSKYLPEFSQIISSNEGNTPLIEIVDNIIDAQIFLKDESTNPTNSFKDRGMPLLIADVVASGKTRVAIPSTGNAAISLVHYAQLAGIKTTVFIPNNTPNSKKNRLGKSQIIEDVDLIESFEHFFRVCKADSSIYNGFPVTSIPYMMGVRTIAFEIYEQMKNTIPDWIIIPAGIGGNIVSQYMGFCDLKKMGLTNKIPRFVSVQVEGADPITVGYNTHSNKVVVLDNPVDSKAEAIASDTSFNYYKIMNILGATNGIAVSVTDMEMENAKNKPFMSNLEFSSTSVYVALHKLKHYITPNQTVVMIGTAGEK